MLGPGPIQALCTLLMHIDAVTTYHSGTSEVSISPSIFVALVKCKPAAGIRGHHVTGFLVGPTSAARTDDLVGALATFTF